MRLNRPKSRNATLPSAMQHEVAGVRVAGELAVAVQAAHEEAEDDLAEPVAVLLRVGLELLELRPFDELRDDHALVREPRHDVGHDDERMAAEDPRQRALVLRLELVVQLLVDAQAHLLGERLDVEARAPPASSAAGSARGSACRRARRPPRRGTGPSPPRRDRRAAARGRPGRSRPRRSAPPRRLAKTSSSGSSNSCSMTLRMSSKRTFGAASRSSPSLRWNSSRYSSGTRPTSRNDITWPSFMAAPFIVPSTATICSAASRWRFSSALDAPSSERATLTTCVPACLTACPAASPADPRRAPDARGGNLVARHALHPRGAGGRRPATAG